MVRCPTRQWRPHTLSQGAETRPETLKCNWGPPASAHAGRPSGSGSPTPCSSVTPCMLDPLHSQLVLPKAPAFHLAGPSGDPWTTEVTTSCCQEGDSIAPGTKGGASEAAGDRKKCQLPFLLHVLEAPVWGHHIGAVGTLQRGSSRASEVGASLHVLRGGPGTEGGGLGGGGVCDRSGAFSGASCQGLVS